MGVGVADCPAVSLDLCILQKKIGPSLLLADARATQRKFRMPTGLPTTNSTNKYPNVKQLSWAIN